MIKKTPSSDSPPPTLVMPSARELAVKIAPQLMLWASIVIACLTVASTYSVFRHTWDEPEHLAAGIALLDTDKYPYDAQHPPLARVAMALGPYLAGAHSHGGVGPSGEQEGRDILYAEGHYNLYLLLARLGMLPFLILLLIATWRWTRHVYGDAAAGWCVAFLITTSTVIGHAGVAALDVPMAATTMLALNLLIRWFDAPGVSRALTFGFAAGIAAGTKLSSIPFIACAALTWFLAAWFISNQASERARTFSRTTFGDAALAIVAALCGMLLCFGLNMHALTASFAALTQHNADGHLSFMLGEVRRTGWWNFYLVALAVKTPLPLLLLGIGGLCGLLWRAWHERRWTIAAPSLAFTAILLFCSAYSHINIGVRHVLILFPLMAIGAAASVSYIWRRFPRYLVRGSIVALLCWQTIDAIRAHPDHLAYFNMLAGKHPERILVDSDLDWGQDLQRLATRLRERNIREVSIVYRGTADLSQEHLPPYKMLWPHQRTTGWIAVSLLAKATGDDGRGYTWLDAYRPVERIGKSIDLYFIPSP